MKKSALVSIIVFLVSVLQAQDSEKKIWLKLFTPHWDNFEYVHGNVQEIHYQAYHITADSAGKVIKGKPFAYEEAQNVEIRQPWSLYFDKRGNLVSMVLQISEDNAWTGVIHSENQRIENVFWMNNDTLKAIWDLEYDGKVKVERHWKFYPEYEVTGTEPFYLDQKGNAMKAEYYDADTLVFVVEFLRNPDGTIKEFKGLDEKRKVKHHYTDFRYNERGLFVYNKIDVLNYEDPQYPTIECYYEYDDHGNWVKRIHPGWMMIQRKISYFQ
jgi:hypothetical protein